MGTEANKARVRRWFEEVHSKGNLALADELGLYSGPLDRMGLLSDQAARAARLVVDSGLHTKGWTRQQAVDYMLNNTAEVSALPPPSVPTDTRLPSS